MTLPDDDAQAAAWVAGVALHPGVDASGVRSSGVRMDNARLLEKDSWGLALQAGFDAKLNRNWCASTFRWLAGRSAA